MERGLVIKKIIEEIKDSNPALPMNYFDMDLYFNMVYTIGFEHGNSDRGRPKPVIHVDVLGKTIREFRSSVEAEKILKIDRGSIRLVCDGRRKSAGGLKFRWREE